jgi:hypothetical protein
MAIAFVQSLFTGVNKSASTTLPITGSATVTVGNTIFIAFAALGNRTGITCTDNLGNTYAEVVRTNNASAVTTSLLQATVTNGGTLTTQTISHPNTNAKEAISVELSGVGTATATGTHAANGTVMNAYPGTSAATTTAQTVGDLWIGAFGWNGPVTDGFSVDAGGVTASEPTAEQGSSGQSATSNTAVGLLYFISNSSTSAALLGDVGTARDFAAVGIELTPAVTASQLLWKPGRGPNYRR